MSGSLTTAVRGFIGRFHECRDIDDVFTRGCCYWFAHILCERFDGSRMMYDPVANHFAAEIGGHVYDITGCIDGVYEYMAPWSACDDPLERERIIRDCIRF